MERVAGETVDYSPIRMWLLPLAALVSVVVGLIVQAMGSDGSFLSLIGVTLSVGCPQGPEQQGKALSSDDEGLLWMRARGVGSHAAFFVVVIGLIPLSVDLNVWKPSSQDDWRVVMMSLVAIGLSVSTLVAAWSLRHER